MYDIVLISPSSRMFNHYRPPVGLIYLAGYLKHKGLNVRILDFPVENEIRNNSFNNTRKYLTRYIKRNILYELYVTDTKNIRIICN